MQEQTKDTDELNQKATQTRNSGVRTRMVMVVAMLIAATTITVFTDGVFVGSLNRIRPDQSWNKHKLVDGLKKLLGSQ